MKTPDTKRMRIAGVLWILSVQYFIAQVIVAAGWPAGARYSWRYNTISDLGNTKCAVYRGNLVCSPRHLVMNLSFIVLGITMTSAAVIAGKRLARSRSLKVGFAFLILSGLGTLLVGIFPENTIARAHILGAALVFIFGNLAMIILGIKLKRIPKLLKAYTLLSGIVGLVALVFFMTHSYIGLGIGGMERFTAYPQTIWMVIVGTYFLISYRTNRGNPHPKIT